MMTMMAKMKEEEEDTVARKEKEKRGNGRAIEGRKEMKEKWVGGKRRRGETREKRLRYWRSRYQVSVV